jgi:hypothetical protein
LGEEDGNPLFEQVDAQVSEFFAVFVNGGDDAGDGATGQGLGGGNAAYI